MLWAINEKIRIPETKLNKTFAEGALSWRGKPLSQLRCVSNLEGMTHILNKRIIRSQLGVQTNINLSQQ